MLVEIPDVGVMIGVFVAFLSGLFAIVIYNKVKPLIRTGADQLGSQLERLQYYENQLIDMKIRLDSLELGREDQVLEPLLKSVERHAKQDLRTSSQEEVKERMHNMNFGNAVDYVLKLITEKSMTSRDIQITIGRTREHTSRMMKKLFEEGYVERNMKTKPFTYYITDKGKAKIGLIKIATLQ
ncbi:MAG: winged helix DNA-binding protein [Nitrososphaerota archaeon]